MKFIFVLVILNVFVQNLSGDYVVEPVAMSAGDDDRLLFVSHFEYDLAQQFIRRSIAIVQSWTQCNESYAVPFNEAMDIFQNPPSGDAHNMTRDAKCLADCTMRRLGVMTDQGLDEAEYMMHIKQLRYNYSSYNMNSKSSDTREKMFDAITKRASDLPTYDVQEYDFFAQHGIPKLPLTRILYDLIRSYTLAARNCSKIKDPTGDDCETSWMVMRCMMEDNRNRNFNSPFYPVQLNALS